MNNNGENNMNNMEPVLVPTSIEEIPAEEVSTEPVTEAYTEPTIEQTNTISSEYIYKMPTTEPITEAPQEIVNEKPLSKKELKKQKKEQAKQDKIAEKKAIEEAKAQAKAAKKAQVQKRSPFFYTLLLLAVIVLAGYVFYSGKVYQSRISELKYACTPITTNKKEERLDVNSTLVQGLYSKVVTNVKEDYASPELDNSMKLYLAYRQIPTNEKYESNCNMWDRSSMEPYYCEVTNSYTPHAFKEESLILQYKKLFGEETTLKLDNVKLQNGCIGGYQYIPDRKEFVEGICDQPINNPIRVKKTLREAISYRNTIILVEDVKYTGSDKVEMPSYLKSGTYYYTFRLDMNYNFVLVSKTYEDLY